MHAKRADGAAVDAPQPVSSGVKKIAVGVAAAVPSKGQASANKGGAGTQVDVRAKTPTTTFLTGGGWEAEDDELAKVRVSEVALFVSKSDEFVSFQDFIIGYELDARLQALQELLGMDRSRALREAINADKRNDHAKLAKLAGSYRHLKAEGAATDAARQGEIEALQAKVALLEAEMQSSSALAVLYFVSLLLLYR